MYRLLRYGKDGNEVSYKIKDIVSKHLYNEKGNPLYQTSQLGELPAGIMREDTTDSIDVLAYLKNDTDLPLSQNISKIINDPKLREKIQYVLGVGTQAFNEDDNVVKILRNKLANFEQVTLGILALKKFYTGKDMQEFKAMLTLYKNDPNFNPNFVSLINDVATSHKLGPEDINKKITEAISILSYLEHSQNLDINNYVVQNYLLREEGVKSPDIDELREITQDSYDLIKKNYNVSQLDSKLAFKNSLAEITPEIEKILKEIIKENLDATLSANSFGEIFVKLNEDSPKIPLRDPEVFSYGTSETNIGANTPILIDQVAAIVKSALYQDKVDSIVSCTIPAGNAQIQKSQENTILEILSKLKYKETYRDPNYINVIRKYFYIPEDIIQKAFNGGDVAELLSTKNFIFQIQNGAYHYVSVSMKIDDTNNISFQYKDSTDGSVSNFNNIPSKTQSLIKNLLKSIKGVNKGGTFFTNTSYIQQQRDGNSCGFWTAVNSLTLGDYQFIPKDEYDILSDSNIRNKIFSKLKPWSINGKIDGHLMNPWGTRNSGRTKTDDTNQGGLLSNFKLTRFIKDMYRTQNNGNDQLEAEKTKINKEVKECINGLNNATSKDDFIAKCKRISENNFSKENIDEFNKLLDHKDKVFDEDGSRRFLEKIISCSEIEDKNYDLQTDNVKKIIDIYRIVSDENDKKIDRIKEVLKDIENNIIEDLLYNYANQNEKIKEINGYIDKKYFYKLFLAASSDKDLIIKIIDNTVYKENNFIEFLNDNEVIEENPKLLIGYSHALYKDLSLDYFCTFLESIPIDYRIAVIRSFKDDTMQNILLKAIEKSDDIEFIQRILPEVNTGKNEELKDILDKTTLTRKTVVKAQEILTLLEKRNYDPNYIDSKQKEIKKIIPYADRTFISAMGSIYSLPSVSEKGIGSGNDANTNSFISSLNSFGRGAAASIMAIPAGIYYGSKKLLGKLQSTSSIQVKGNDTDIETTPLLKANREKKKVDDRTTTFKGFIPETQGQHKKVILTDANEQGLPIDPQGIQENEQQIERRPRTRNSLLNHITHGNINMIGEKDYFEATQITVTSRGENTVSPLLNLKNAGDEINDPSLIAYKIVDSLENEDAKSALRTLFLQNFPVNGSQANASSDYDHFINSVNQSNIDESIKKMIIEQANQIIGFDDETISESGDRIQPLEYRNYGTFNKNEDVSTTETPSGNTLLCAAPFGLDSDASSDYDTVGCFNPFLGGRSRFSSDDPSTPLTFSGGGRVATPPKQTLFPPRVPDTFLNAVIHSPADKKADRQTNFDSLLGLAREQKTNISSDFVTNNPDQSIEDKFRKDHDFSISYVDVADNQEQKEKDIIYMAASAALDLKLEPVIIYGGTYEEQIIAIKSALRQGFTAITVCEPKKGTKPDEYTELLNLTRMIRDNYKDHGSCLDTMNNIENQRVTVKDSVNNVLTDTEKALYNDIMSIPTPTHNHIASP